jgi:hypothetical protein
MALISTTPVSENTATSKTIVIRAINGIMYTVPTGKTFKGYVAVSIGLGCQAFVNGVEFVTLAPTTPYYLESLPLTLVAGNTVSSGVNYQNWTLFGTEQ